MKKLHPKIWELIVKSYRHAHNGYDYLLNLIDCMPLSTEFVVDEKMRKYDLLHDSLVSYLTALPLNEGLFIIKDALDDKDIKKMDKDNWNYYGDYVKYWRGEIIEYLGKSGITYDEEKGIFEKSGKELDISHIIGSKSEFITSTFPDEFYNNLKNEINKSYRFKIYTGSFLLSRKLIENLVIELLRLKFPPVTQDNRDIYHRTTKNRFHDFSKILENMEENKEEFGVDTPIIEEFISLVKPFRPKANAKAHSIIMKGEEKELNDLKIQRMVDLLLKVHNNLKYDLEPRD